MLAGVPALVGLLLSSSGDVDVALGLGTDARVRRLGAEERTWNETAWQLSPGVSLTALTGGATIAAAYDVDLRMRTVGGSSSTRELLHRGKIRAASVEHGLWRLRAEARGSYGTTDLTTEALRQPSMWPDPIPTRSSLAYVEAAASLGVTGALDRRLELQADAGARLNGGADDAARRQVPIVTEVVSRAALAWQASRRDVLTAATEFASTFIPADRSSAHLGIVSGSWRHRIRHDLEGTLGAGIAVGITSRTEKSDGIALLPVVEGALAHEHERLRLTTRVALRADPYADRATARLEKRLALAIVSTWRVSDPFTVSVHATAAVLPDGFSKRMSQVTAYAGAGWAVARQLTLGLGVVAVSQRSRDPAWPSFFEYGPNVTVVYVSGTR